MISRKYSKQLLIDAIAISRSWREVCIYFNLVPVSGSQTHLKNMAVKYEIDYSHFPGKAWSRNKQNKRTPLEKYFSGEVFITSHNLKLKLFRDNIKQQRCEICLLSEWMGSEIPLELNHIDNNHFNNALENLEILCPTCHAIKTRASRKKNVPVDQLVESSALEAEC